MNRANVPGIIVETTSSGSAKRLPIEIYWRTRFGSGAKGANRPVFFLNEMRLDYMSALDLLGNLRVIDVALIRVYQPGTFAVGNAPSGAVLVYTKNSKDYQFDSSYHGHLNKIVRSGYSVTDPLPVMPLSGDKNGILYVDNISVSDSSSRNFILPFSGGEKNAPKRIRVEGVDKNGAIVALDKIIY